MTEINVAYDGTSADLFGGGNALFDNFDWDSAAMTGSFDSTAAGSDFSVLGVSSAHNGTVSPKDLFTDATTSVPPSSTFTNLTTPGSALLDTPNEEFESSPLFTDNLGVDSRNNDPWFSLFPECNGNTSPSAPAMTRTISASSGKQVMVHPGGESRKRQSSTASPMVTGSRPSSTAGVHKKREKTLAPIVADPDDIVGLKRARNTAAARKSREKKVQEIERFQERIAALESEVEHWKSLAMARHPVLES